MTFIVAAVIISASICVSVAIIAVIEADRSHKRQIKTLKNIIKRLEDKDD